MAKLVTHYPEAPPSLPSPNRQPLGRGADINEDYHTREVRNVLVDNLRRYYSGDLSGNPESHRYQPRELVGIKRQPKRYTYPPDELVTRLELGFAMKLLEQERPRPFDFLLLFVMGDHILGVPVEPNPEKRRPLARREIAERNHHKYKVISGWIDEGLDFLIDLIWRDE